MKVDCWGKMTKPMTKVAAKFSKRIGIRKSGHVKLHQDIQQCDYEDVHVLWNMLKSRDTDLARSEKSKSFWDFVEWAKHTALIYRAA